MANGRLAQGYEAPVQCERAVSVCRQRAHRFPSSTSGAAHCTVPIRLIALVYWNSRERPKSATRTERSAASSRLRLFRSR
eukprot:1260488-Prymnesium_polylepis.1